MGTGKSLILMYHRIAEIYPDPWGLCVQPKHFQEHLDVLVKMGGTIKLRKMLEGLEAQDLPDQSIVLTFDDGYSDNFEIARPELECREIPATFFIVSGILEGNKEYWWDELDSLLEPGVLPQHLLLHIKDTIYEWNLGEDAQYSAEVSRLHQHWKTWEQPPTIRHSLYLSLWQRMMSLQEHEKEQVLEDLCRWMAEVGVCREQYQTLSTEEVRQLSRSDLFEIGAHSATHSALPGLSAEMQQREIEESKTILENMVLAPVVSFAYPHGQFDSTTISVARKSGVESACSTVAERVSDTTDYFQLPRVQVLDWNGDEFSQQLAKYLE